MTRNAAIILATSALLLGGTVQAQAQNQHGKRDEAPAAQRNDNRNAHAQQGQPAAQSQQGRQQDQRGSQQDQRGSRQEQPQRIQQDQQQKRAAQVRAQQQYEQNVREQQARLRQERDHRDQRYANTPALYRYRLGNLTRQTNQYGANLLRQAVSFGYQEGYRAGQADRQDRYHFDYADAYAYRDANYGYSGSYVERGDYNAYFREGFRRGYEDGFYSRAQYGRITPSGPVILAAVLTGILVLTVIR